MRILSIHAHPDDAEILAGGTLALLAAAGHHIVIVSMTPGDCGTRDYPPDEIAEIRRRESERSANSIGADYLCAEFRDMSIFNDNLSRRRVTEILRRERPDIVLTASPADYHCDHEATSVLVRDACFGGGAPNYQTGAAEPLNGIPHLYFMDPVEGRDREGNLVVPDFVVDVAEVLDRKRAMLGCHESQRRWLQQHHGIDDYIDTMEQWTRARGGLAGFEYGEGFRQYRCQPFPRTPALQKLLPSIREPGDREAIPR